MLWNRLTGTMRMLKTILQRIDDFGSPIQGKPKSRRDTDRAGNSAVLTDDDQRKNADRMAE